ncbi:MAG: hypothetical protein RSC05_08215 [Acinetobacter sp.]
MAQAIGKTESTFAIRKVEDLEEIELGKWILVNGEHMAVTAISETEITVKRGVNYTVPQDHAAGSMILFCDDYIALDETDYFAGESLNVKALTKTGSAQLALGSVTAHTIEMVGLANRPYPPANVKINNEYWPQTLLVAADLVVTWVHRNRLQQTGGTPLGFYEGGITVESGVTYSIELSTVLDGVLLFEENINDDTFIIAEATILPNKAHKLKLWSVREGYESMLYEHNFFAEAASLILTAATDGNHVEGNTVPAAAITIDVDTSIKANMRYDGSSISGKAQPNATIIIEVGE